MSKDYDKEKQETMRVLKDAKGYQKETEKAIGSLDEKEFTDYQHQLALEWYKRQAGIK